MALIFEEFADSESGKKVAIPQKVSDTLKGYKDSFEAQLGKGQDLNMLPGGGVLKKWSSDTHYNEKKNANKNGKAQTAPTITPNDANVFLTRKNKSINTYGEKSPKNSIYASDAGKIMTSVAKEVVKKGRREGQKVQAVKPVKPNAQASTKPAEVKTKEITTPKGSIKYAVTVENRKIYVSEGQLVKIRHKIV